MKRANVWLAILGVLLGAAVCAVRAAQSDRADDLTVHEWGTFLAMNGSDGVALDGMYHEEHALPAFVHARSKDQLRLHSADVKGETPVIYFYTPRAMDVSVKVEFPGGIWTQWYPQAAMVGPSPAQMATPPELRGGHIQWWTHLTPASDATPELPRAPSDSLWNYARKVDSAVARTADESRSGARQEQERFLFYRGLGRADLPVEISAANGGTLTCSASLPQGVRHLFVIQVVNGQGVYRYIPALKPGEQIDHVIPGIKDSAPVAIMSQAVGDKLATSLRDSGLFEKEATAMVKTWRTSYFESPGIRVLFVLPREWTDRFIPMTITPQPGKIVRVMVGRVEMLSPERERAAESAVRDLASIDPTTREHAFVTLRDQGRYVEPVVRRIERTTTDSRVRTLCKRLLLTDFVNELRATILSASNGARTAQKPIHVRAQLAAVLRECGLDSQAESEGREVIAALQHEKRPPMSSHESRLYLRDYARATEGLGDSYGAAHWYGEFVRFGSQEPKCGGCHEMQGPRDMSFFRDWWAGRRFGHYAARAGETDKLIHSNVAALQQNPGDRAAQLQLAYLYESIGKKDSAARMWASLDSEKTVKR